MRTPQIALTFAALGSALAIAPTAHAQRDAQRDAQRWDWSGTVSAGKVVYIRNLNGAIRVEPTSGNTVEVVANKEARRRGDVDEVKITVEQRSNGGDVVICAIWNENTRCDEDGYRSNSNRNWRNGDRSNGNDVKVEFTVRLPKGVNITASTVNGALDIEGVDAEVVANTVNGSIVARSNTGPVSAKTVNGSLTIRTGDLGRASLDYSTVNGQITLEIPGDSNADVELRTVNGSISTDFPLTIEGRFSNRRVRGTIGRAARRFGWPRPTGAFVFTNRELLADSCRIGCQRRQHIVDGPS